MVKKGRPSSKEPPRGPGIAETIERRVLHLGRWLARLDRKQGEVADKVGIGKSYMSNLVSNKVAKKPSPDVLLALSEELGITVNDLYREPPPRLAVEAAKKLRPDQISALGDFLTEYKTRR